MVKPVSQLKTAAAVLFVAPVALLSACSPNEPVATQPGTTPADLDGIAGAFGAPEPPRAQVPRRPATP